MHAADTPSAGELFVAVPSGREEPLPRAVHNWIDRLVQRATGSTALNMALVASGALDAAFGAKCRLWDIAAGVIICQEAGAAVTDHRGNSYFPMDLASYQNGPMPFLVARPALQQQLRDELQANGQ
jgi:fructose-1,6-bisphosphatase/inositol monophosphatase family enzyme